MRLLLQPTNLNPPWLLVGVISNGQSLSVGYDGAPITLIQPYNNVQLWDTLGSPSGYNITNPSATTLELQPLVAPQRSNFPETVTEGYAQYPGNVFGESADVSYCNNRTKLAISAGYTNYRTIPSCTGVAAASLNIIVKGGSTNAYAAGLYEVQAIKNLVSSFGVEAILFTHGETDAQYYTTISTYSSGIITLISNYQSDISSITGQSAVIAFIASQQNSTSAFIGQFPQENTTAQALFELIDTENFYLSGPKYQYPYDVSDPSPHLDNYGYIYLGEKYAQVAHSISLGNGWLPLYPTNFIKNNGSTNGIGTTSVTVTFHVPVPPMLIDTTTFPAPHQTGILDIWSNGYGFEAADITTLNITNVTATSPIQVTTETPHGLSTGQIIAIPSVNGITQANGCFEITVIDSENFTLNGTTGTGSYEGSYYPSFASYQIAILLPIVSVNLSGDSVTIILGASAQTQLSIGCADTGNPDASDHGGVIQGNRYSNLRDSDPYTGISATPNYNWVCEFFHNIA